MHDRQRLPHPINDRTRIALRTILTWIDERAETQKQAAASFAKDEQYDDAAEADALASAYRSTADFIRELAGDVTPPGRFVRVHVADLARLLVEPVDAQPSENSGEFDDDLVEQLARAGFAAFREVAPDMHMADWNDQPTGYQERMRKAVHAILAELAKASVELPTDEQVQIAAYDIGNSDGVMTLEAAGRRVATLFRDRVAPAIAAKDARIDELQRMLTGAHGDADAARDELASVVKERDELAEANRDVNATADQLIARINELEARVPANSCDDSERAQYELTIEQQQAKIAEHEAHTATFDELRTELAKAHGRIRELETATAEIPNYLAYTRKLESAYAELEKRLAEHGSIHGKPLAEHLLSLLDAKPNEGVVAAIERLRKERTEERRAIRVALGESEIVGTLADDVAEVVRERDELRAKLASIDEKHIADKAECLRLGNELRANPWTDEDRAQLLELAKNEPLSADGKTLGQVGFEGYRDARHKATGEWSSWDHGLTTVQHDWWQSGAHAVLRAFGPRMVWETLVRVREQMWADKIEIPFGDGSKRLFVRAESVARIIDDEIATTEAQKPMEQVDVAVREVLDRMTAPEAERVREVGSSGTCDKT